jgi:hypothetical protein
MLSVIELNESMPSVVHAKCRVFIPVANAIVLNAVMPSVLMLSAFSPVSYTTNSSQL